MLILDGGIGRHLKKIGAPFGQPEWSALALIEDPSFVSQAHNDFINAGADIITTNSYAIVPFHIGEKRFREIGKELMLSAARIANKCSLAAEKKIKIAAGIPPVFGSYKPHSFVYKDALPILELFKECLLPSSDLVLAETLSCIEEIKAVQTVFLNCDQPLWLSFTLDDDLEDKSISNLRSGESLKEALKSIDFDKVEAILFNCSQPEVMENALRITRDIVSSKILTGAYANTFPSINSSQKDANSQLRELREELTPEIYKDFALKWVEAGASIIGGCCGIGPEHIEEISKIKDQLIKLD